MNSRPIKLTNKTQNIRISHKSPRIVIRQVGGQGKPGTKGDKGDDGRGLPLGGIDGQVLVKDTDTDLSYRWETAAIVDKYYEQSFTTSSEVIITHNLGKYPALTILDSAGDEVRGRVEHIDINNAIVRFSAPFSGRVTCS